MDIIMLSENDVFNLNTNIQKFSYKNIKNQQELRQLKLEYN